MGRRSMTAVSRGVELPCRQCSHMETVCGSEQVGLGKSPVWQKSKDL